MSYSLQDFEDNLGMIRFVRTLRDGAVAAGIYLSIKVTTFLDFPGCRVESTQESGTLTATQCDSKSMFDCYQTADHSWSWSTDA